MVVKVGIVGAGDTLPTVATKSSFTIPVPGDYLVAFTSVSAGAFTAALTLLRGGSINMINQFNSYTTGSLGTFGSPNTAIIIVYMRVTSQGTGSANTVNIVGGTGLSAGNADIYIVPYSNIAQYDFKPFCVKTTAMSKTKLMLDLTQQQQRLGHLEDTVRKMFRMAQQTAEYRTTKKDVVEFDSKSDEESEPYDEVTPLPQSADLPTTRPFDLSQSTMDLARDIQQLRMGVTERGRIF